MIKNMICIECPKGCNLSVDVEGCAVKDVRGARCPKGVMYAASEINNPMRIFTTTVLTEGLSLKLVPARTDKPIPKKDLFGAVEAARKIRIKKPLKTGDAIVENFHNLGVRLIATREIDK